MPLSPEDLAQIKAMLTETIPGMVTEAATPLITKALDARLKGAMTTEEFEKYKLEQKAAADRAAAEKAAEGEGKPAGKGKAGESEQSPEYRKAMAKIEELERQAVAEREARKAAEAQRLQDQRNVLIRDALAKAGVDPRAQKAALNHILAEGWVKIKDDGKVVYQTANQFGGADETGVEEGVAAFLKTQDGRLFLPADSVRGNGAGNNGSNVRNQSGAGQTVRAEDIVLGALAGH